MEHAAQTAVLVVFWILLAPIALAIAAVMALPRILRSVPRCIGLVLEFVWLLLALVFHVVHSSLHALGMAQREHGYLFKAYARRVGRDVLSALRRAWRISVAFDADALRILRAGGRLLRRKVSRTIRSSALPSEPCARPPGAVHDFEKRYRIVRRLPPGGSTAQLFVVRRIEGARETGGELVLKYFDLTLGSHLENMIRESGAVQLATRLGLVLDSGMTGTSFYYVMPYYHGETLTKRVLALHDGLADGSRPADPALANLLRWIRDLLQVIVRYHEAGVFHKDIKPDNLIVEEDRIRLIDIGLLTPLESTLQLTTHGTEYFRDPEMVKLAARGTRIREVDCAKFDIYSIGAVFHFLLEGSFPVSGSLSRYSKPVPFCLQWISTRAMADFDKRYASAREMLQDVEDVLQLGAKSPLDDVRVSSLSSFRREAKDAGPPEMPLEPGPAPIAVEATAAPGAVAAAAATVPSIRAASVRGPRIALATLALAAVLALVAFVAALDLEPVRLIGEETFVSRSSTEISWPSAVRKEAWIREGVSSPVLEAMARAGLEQLAGILEPETRESLRRLAGNAAEALKRVELRLGEPGVRAQTVELPTRNEVIEWLAARIGEVRPAAPGPGVASHRVRLIPLAPGSDGEGIEIFRELKLSLALQGIPFESTSAGTLASEDDLSLGLGFSRENDRRRVQVTLRHPGGLREWSLSYP